MSANEREQTTQRGLASLRGKVAVVTGAASGIGGGIARAAARAGMRVVVADVEPKGLERIEGELRALGGEVAAVPTDVRRAEAVDALARAAFERFGAVHLLCNNAGVLVGGVAWERTDDDWRWVLDVNLFGVVNGLRSFLPRLIAQGDPAHVVNTASVGGLLVGPYLSPYLVSKHAVVVLTESVYHELAAEGAPVGISVLCPGPIATGITDSERIRPSDRPATRALHGAGEKAFDTMLRTGVAAGMAPDRVGEIVLEAVRAGRFWIHTHDIPETPIRERTETIVRGENPVYLAGFGQRMLEPE